MSSFSVEEIRRDFPILERHVNGYPLVYLDSAATSQKPNSVLDAIREYYLLHNANVHRGIHTLAEEATQAYEDVRKKVARFIGAAKASEIVFTRGTTESINLVAYAWGMQNLKAGDRVVLTEMEHHANLVPWFEITRRTGAEISYIPVNNQGILDLRNLSNVIDQNTKMVALTQMSNVLGTINPVKEIIKFAHETGALALVDGAQSAPHMPVDVQDLDADFFAFSAHKMLGPTGVGVLYGKQNLLEQMEPFQFGGEMISEVRYDRATWADVPHKFEGGTPNIEGVYAFAAALEYLNHLGMENIRSHEIEITEYALKALMSLGYVKIFGPLDPQVRGGAISFEVEGIHPHDLSTFLDSRGVAIRAGHHCAQPLHRKFGVPSSTRASFYIYNTFQEVDRLIEVLEEARRYFRL